MAVSLSILGGAGAQFFDNNGDPLSGGLIYTYDAGTTTPRATYTTSAGSTPNANPIVLDSAGRVTTQIWLTSGINYKFVLKTSSGVTLDTEDNLYGVPGSDSSQIIFVPSGTGAVTTTVQAKLREYVSLTDYDTLRNAIATGKLVKVPCGTSPISISTTDSPYILPSLDHIHADCDLTLSLASGVHTTASNNICNVGNNGNITIEGAAPAETTLVSITSVSGSSGNYSVVLEVVDGSGVSVGSFLKIDNAVPLMTFSGDNSALRDRVAENELGNQLANLGGVTAATGGGSASWDAVLSGSLSDYVSVGDLLTLKGQTRVVSSVGVSSVGITGAWDLGVTATRAWYLSRPNSGTVGTASSPNTTVTGSSSQFSSEANVGDLLLAEGRMSVITAIGGATTMTVSPAITLANGTVYSIITPACAHEGTHEVLSVTGTSVTVRNRWRGVYAPPVNRVSGGDVKVIRTILKNSGTGDGFSFAQNSSIKWINDLVLQGSGVSDGSHGLAMDGRTDEGPTQIGPVGMANAGDGFAVIDWGRGAFLGNGCILQTRKSHYCGNLSFGVWCLEGSVANMRETVVSGTNGRGIQLNSNATLLFTEGESIGNASDGLSAESGATIYSEIPLFWQNGSMGVRFTGVMGFNITEGISGLNVDSGLFGSAASNGDFSRVLFCANGRENIELLENSNVVGEEFWSTGARGTTGSGYGIYSSNACVVADGCALINNSGGPGNFTGNCAAIDAPLSYVRGTENDGFNVVDQASGRFSDGVVDEVNVTLGGTIYVDGVSVPPTLNGVSRLNELSARWAQVKNDSSTDGVGVAALRIGGGAVANKMLQALTVFDFGTINAGASSTQTVAVSGASTSGIALVGISNQSSLITAGIVLDAAITATDTVSVRAYNYTGGNLVVGSQSFRVVVLEFA